MRPVRRGSAITTFREQPAGLGFFGDLFGVAIGYVFVLVANCFFSKTVSSSSLSGANFSVPLWLVVVVIIGTTLIGPVPGAPCRSA